MVGEIVVKSQYMELSKKLWVGVVGIIIVLLIALFMAFRDEKVPVPSDGAPIAREEVEEDGSLVEEETTQAPPAPATFTVNAKDTIASWKFTGRYAGNETLTINAQTDIARLQAFLGTGEYQDYDLYNGIGNNYTYLGDGEKAFAAYKKAISLDAGRAIVYMNIGSLMEQLAAYNTAKDAYAKAVAAEPGVAQYKNAQIDFLARIQN
jgi:tetratricopeptide (TPR) repeat protein